MDKRRRLEQAREEEYRDQQANETAEFFAVADDEDQHSSL
jgi:hypothetical protein